MDTAGYYSQQERAEVRIDTALAAAQYEQSAVNAHHAATIVAIHEVLDEARENPEVYVGDHAMRSNRDSSNRERVEFAERAAIADLAVRLALSENTIRSYEYQAVTMIARTPLLWQKFRWGDISPANARVVAEFAATLPDGDLEAFARFDSTLAEPAGRMAPARFRSYVRRLRESLVADTAAERHERERASRRVAFEPDIDGMAWISAYLPADIATAAMARLDAEALARSAASSTTGDARTLAQLRADIFGEWMTGVGSTAPVGVRVGVLIPMLSLLGLSEQPASLEGYGPIDADTARRLVGDASSLFRILTDPVSGAILDIDQPTKHIPQGLRRMRQLIDETCTFPGCGRRAQHCDLDHTVDRQFGGRTKLTNLSHLCRKHHRVKHQTLWAVAQDTSRTTEWTSPTGFVARPDPPPF